MLWNVWILCDSHEVKLRPVGGVYKEQDSEWILLLFISSIHGYFGCIWMMFFHSIVSPNPGRIFKDCADASEKYGSVPSVGHGRLACWMYSNC